MLVTGVGEIVIRAASEADAEIARRMVTRPRLPWLVAEVDGDVAGYAYASAHRQRATYRWSADCSVYVDASSRSGGVGQSLYERLIAELGALGYASVLAGIALPNPTSIGLLQSLGFQPASVFRRVGYKFGSWHDVGWWQLMLSGSARPRPSRPSGTRADRPRWAR